MKSLQTLLFKQELCLQRLIQHSCLGCQGLSSKGRGRWVLRDICNDPHVPAFCSRQARAALLLKTTISLERCTDFTPKFKAPPVNHESAWPRAQCERLGDCSTQNQLNRSCLRMLHHTSFSREAARDWRVIHHDKRQVALPGTPGSESIFQLGRNRLPVSV